jgi:hypothetical protein
LAAADEYAVIIPVAGHSRDMRRSYKRSACSASEEECQSAPNIQHCLPYWHQFKHSPAILQRSIAYLCNLQRQKRSLGMTKNDARYPCNLMTVLNLCLEGRTGAHCPISLGET